MIVLTEGGAEMSKRAMKQPLPEDALRRLGCLQVK